ncbi:uncharacterized protein BO72DRAFT_150237 [Aspergillus fijiensis CBS 313.89]|uniref:Uncharacterized protein n=1 Tax=Aspergillus fijiensis CBS 313.89 TaxID=1448319 RepID=A0A8G1RQN6_9EURO|nr:uncharacterized protein BO72DRAFT_150237 [Aspergillus fijiensis CBS 313.89]RAK76150.1 hypothetical protein BO72DRAFT_150237 [Aspergillus fijiensis CBS 313.89]
MREADDKVVGASCPRRRRGASSSQQQPPAPPEQQQKEEGYNRQGGDPVVHLLLLLLLLSHTLVLSRSQCLPPSALALPFASIPVQDEGAKDHRGKSSRFATQQKAVTRKHNRRKSHTYLVRSIHVGCTPDLDGKPPSQWSGFKQTKEPSRDYQARKIEDEKREVELMEMGSK